MAFGSFLKLFMPKDRVFYSLFEEVAGNLKKMGETFNQAMSLEDNSMRESLLRTLEELEHKNDAVTHQIFIELGQNFITPFDREDIHTLATALDDIADYIWGSTKRILNYQIDSVDETMIALSKVIVKCIDALQRAIRQLRDMKDVRAITNACVSINEYENEADEILDQAMVTLFTHPNISPIELIKLKDLYQELEIVTDKCEDAANVIESIIIKYA